MDKIIIEEDYEKMRRVCLRYVESDGYCLRYIPNCFKAPEIDEK